MWSYPSDSIGIALDWQIDMLHDFIDYNESKLKEERAKFNERVKKGDFLVEIDDDISYQDIGKDLIESSLEEYEYNSRKFILIQLISLYEEYLYILFYNSVKDTNFEVHKSNKDKGVKRYIKYLKEQLKVDIESFSKEIGFINICIELRHQYIHKPSEEILNEKINKLMNSQIGKHLIRYNNIAGIESILIKDNALLYTLSVNIKHVLFSISAQLSSIVKIQSISKKLNS
jgi:hypothetical protein